MCKLFFRSTKKPRIIFWDAAFFTLHTPSFPLLPAQNRRERPEISSITRGKVTLFWLGDENKFGFEKTKLPLVVNLHSCNSVISVSDSSVHIVAERPHCSIKADFSLLRLNCKCARVINHEIRCAYFFFYWRTLALYICTVFIRKTNTY